MEIQKEYIAKIPQEISSNLLGIRIIKNLAYVMGINGNYITINLNNKEIKKYKLKTIKVIDFAVKEGNIIYINENGKLCGQVYSQWSKDLYLNNCRIETSDQGTIISCDNKVLFLANNATTSFKLPNLSYALPINNELIWGLSINKDKLLEANLYNFDGKLINNIYKFNKNTELSYTEIGPCCVEGELLISTIENKSRTLALIGNDGRIFWKINGPKKVCNRDRAFDEMDNIFVLEKKDNNEVFLYRWELSLPEG
jgi:hypothetical protein